MPLLYKARKIKSFIDGNMKYVPVLAKFSKRITTRQIAQDMSYGTTMAPGDLYHALISLPQYIFPYLLNSHSVHLEGLGTFTIVAKSKGGGVETPEEVNADQIKYLRVQFTPEYTMSKGVGKTRSQFANVSFERWDGKTTEKSSSGESGGGDGGYEQDPNA